MTRAERTRGRPAAGAGSVEPGPGADLVPVEVAVLDRAGVIVSVNQEWVDFCLANGGDPARAGVGVCYLEVCDAAGPDPAALAVGAAIRRALAGGLPAPRRVDIPCDSPDEERRFEVQVASRLDEDGACVGGIVTLSRSGALPDPDPSPRMPPETAAPLLEAVPDGLVVVGAGGRISYVNRVLEELSGYPREELVGRPVEVLVPEPSRARHHGLHREYAMSPRSRLMGQGTQLQLRRADGSLVPVEISLAPTSVDGQQMVLAGVRDLRGERLAAQERLRVSQESFRAAFDQAPIAMSVARMGDDGSRVILRANPALGALLGMPAGELVGRDFAEFTYPEDEAVDELAAVELASGGRTEYVRHKRYRRADGSDVWVEFRAAPVAFPDLPGATTLAHYVDVTARHRAEQDRARRAAAAEAVAQVTTAVLADRPMAEVYPQIVGRVAEVFRAENVTLGFIDVRTETPVPVAAVGPVSTALVRGELPVSPDFVRRLLAETSFASPEPPTEVDPRVRDRLGPWAATRFGPGRSGPGRPGLLTVGRAPGGAPFSTVEVALLGEMADQLALAIELGNVRAGSERLALLEERQRIARDLHDHVIQDLFAIGMQLTTRSLQRPDPADADADGMLIDQVDRAIRRLRGSVFELSEPPVRGTAGETVRAVVADAARVLGHRPGLTLTGPVDGLPAPVVEDLVAVLREALSNTARHANATATGVRVEVGDSGVTLTVEDDGTGIPDDHGTGHGLANIRARAEQWHGQVTIGPRRPSGTRVLWTAPTTSGAAAPSRDVHRPHRSGDVDAPSPR